MSQKVYKDSSCNLVHVEPAGDYQVARLVDNPSHGYICWPGDFGTPPYADSPAVCCWFGEGERYPDAESTLAAVVAG